jgi:septal ring factor EnvC (AmiA/AmiB activator)
LLLAAAPSRGQVPDPGMAAQQDPAMVQDTEAAREKLLKAADELDMIQSNSETNRAAIDAMKTDIAHLQADNADLKQQIAALQATLDKSEADRAKERQALLDEVADLIAKSNAPHGVTLHHHEPADDAATASTEVHTSIKNEVAETDASAGPAPHAATDSNSTAEADSAPADTAPAPAPKPKPQKGYYHVVASGETLSMICAAYRDEGVKVTTAQVRKANGLTSKSALKVGQKLFIPKPAE